MGPGVVAAVGELSQEEEEELGLQSLVVGGACSEWESLVPAYTSSSIFCEKLRGGEVGERDNVSDESGSGVSGGCEMLSWLPWLFPKSRPWLLSLGAVVVRHSLNVMSSVGRAQPECP